MLDGLIKLLEWVFEKFKDYFSPLVVLRCYEAGVLLRNGKYLRDLHVGWNWKIPLFDEVHTVVKTVDTFHVAAVDITTLDNKQVSVEPIIKFEIIDPRKYIIEVNQAADNLHDIARGIIADYLTDCDWEDIKKKTTLTEIKNKLKGEFEEMGVKVYKVYFGRIVTTRMFTVFKE